MNIEVSRRDVACEVKCLYCLALKIHIKPFPVTQNPPSSRIKPPLEPPNRPSSHRETELAGGVEDWADVNGGDADRYGFISIRRGTVSRPGTPAPRPP